YVLIVEALIVITEHETPVSADGDDELFPQIRLLLAREVRRCREIRKCVAAHVSRNRRVVITATDEQEIVPRQRKRLSERLNCLDTFRITVRMRLRSFRAKRRRKDRRKKQEFQSLSHRLTSYLTAPVNVLVYRAPMRKFS